MRHTPDTEDVRRMIDRRIDRLLAVLDACAQGNADGNINFRDVQWIRGNLAALLDEPAHHDEQSKEGM